jgi:CheY-like chemotaxis protein
MPAKRILIVDDQRDITRMIRAALEMLGRGYIMVDVPSGEEAVLEMGRGGVDLLITDVRLPGMNGFDLIKRLQRNNPKAKAIVISGLPDSKTASEAQRLGAVYFAKPLRKMEDFLQTVQQTLGDDAAPAAAAAPLTNEQTGVSDRLATLRRDLGANAVFLVDLDARIVVRAGDVPGLDTDAVLAQLMVAFSASMKLCRLLGGYIPTNVHFFDGDEFDVYAANVGQYFAIVIVFDGDRGAGQMGPVMRYGRQCADDLLNSLVMMGVAPEAEALPPIAPVPRPAAPAPSPPARKTPGPSAVPASPASPAPVPEPAPAPVAVALEPPKPLTEEELKALDEAAKKVSSQAADSFWDEALAEAEATDVRPDALSWEQAEKLGLVPKKEKEN